MWTYTVTLMSFGTVQKTKRELIADLVTCKPRMTESGMIIAIEFLRMVNMVTSLGIVFPFYIVLLYLATLAPYGQREIDMQE